MVDREDPNLVSEEEQSEEEEHEDKLSMTEIIKTLFWGFLFFIFLRGTIAEARYIPSGSMIPTLNLNDRILVQKLTKHFQDTYKRGDIIVFYPPPIETEVEHDNELAKYIPFVPESPPAYIKRVIGVPGDQIQVVRNKGLYINGKFIEESYINEPPKYDLSQLGQIRGMNQKGHYIEPYGDSPQAIVVPEGHLFVMGDNRNASADSHVWGFLDQKRVVGKLCLVFWRGSWLKL